MRLLRRHGRISAYTLGIILLALPLLAASPAARGAPPGQAMPERPTAATPTPGEGGVAALPAPTEPSANEPLPVGEAPLLVDQRASTSHVAPGESFFYIVTVMSRRSAGVVEMRAFIDGPVEVVSVSQSEGSCSIAAPVQCSIAMGPGSVSTIQITVRAALEAAPGSVAVGQAVAEDELSNTAASDQVVVEVAAPPTQVAVEDRGPAQAEPTATLTPIVSDEGDPGSLTALPTATSGLPARQTPSPAPSVAPATPTPSPLATATATPVRDEEEEITPSPTAELALPTLPLPRATVAATASPEAPAVRPPTQDVPLPETSAASPLVGIFVGLFGLAAAVHGARRVRSAGAQIAGQRLAPHLAPLIAALRRQQRRVAHGVEVMDEQTRALDERISPK